MDITTRFRLNSPKVVHEAFDDEVVIVNLETGRYYCLQRTSAALWHLLLQSASAGDIAALFTRQFSGHADEVERQTAALVRTLFDDGLIVEAPGASFTAAAADGSVAETRTPFELPPLQTYGDMQDLLVLDPIHEVDETGWPMAKPPATE